MALEDEAPAEEPAHKAPTGEAETKTETEEASDAAEDGFPSFDELLGSFMGEPSLWPVLIVLLGSAGAFGAAALVLAFVDHNPFAAAALVLVVGMSLDIFFRGQRDANYRNAGRLIAMIWLSALAFTGLAIWTGLAFGQAA